MKARFLILIPEPRVSWPAASNDRPKWMEQRHGTLRRCRHRARIGGDRDDNFQWRGVPQ